MSGASLIKCLGLLLVSAVLSGCSKVPLVAVDNVKLRWPGYTVVRLEDLDWDGSSVWLAVPPTADKCMLLIQCDDDGKIWKETPTGLYIERSRNEPRDFRPAERTLQNHFFFGKYEGLPQVEDQK